MNQKISLENLESEKRKISRELHDDLGQRLTLIKYALLSDANKEDIIELVHESIESLRRISHELSPEYIRKTKLVVLISELLDRYNVSHIGVSFKHFLADIEQYISIEQKLNLFRIVQESTNNIIKHSLANQCEINLSIQEENYILKINHNGVSFDYETELEVSKGIGLVSTHQRVKALSGTLKNTLFVDGINNVSNQLYITAPLSI